jgi:hypothetical protein
MDFDNRVAYADNLSQISLLLNRDFAGKFPVPIRGIMTSIGSPLSIACDPEVLERLGFPSQLKSLAQVLEEGTEYPIDRFNGGRITTLAVNYPSAAADWAFTYAKGNAERIQRLIQEGKFSADLKSILRPAIIAYDKVITARDPTYYGFDLTLPEDKALRSRAILKAYVNMDLRELEINEPAF